ncbi:CHAT domain-containing protein [Kibdelosporangium persicum]|uniref:Lead, cadmium, zinc and mercury transporting ATPase n=1 Tax=Kibdelosporangium persicum TaxID=2698649 RepID=A0ABX2EZV7_9PSEU|nr:Lead, cadmium, zinc and mercury transporting ATPase [Kibdelosporangium persicum]
MEIGHAGRYTQENRLLRRALALLESVGPSDSIDWIRTRARILITVAFAEAESGTLAQGLAQLDALRPEVEAVTDEAIRAELLGAIDGNHAGLLLRSGRYEESIPLLDSSISHNERNLELGTDDLPRLINALAASLSNRGLAYLEIGRIEPAFINLNRAITIGQDNDLPMRVAYVHHLLGDLYQRAGDIPEALRYYQLAERDYLELAPFMLPRLRIDQAQALISAGLADEVAKHLDDVLPQMQVERVQQDLAEAELMRATAALMEDNLSLGRKLANSARRRFKRRGSDAWAAVAALIGLRVDVAQAWRGKRIPASLPARASQLADELTSVRLMDEAAIARTLAARLEVRRGNIAEAKSLLGALSRPGPLTPIEQRMLLRLTRAELAAAEGNRRQAFAQARAGLGDLGRARDRMGGLELVSATAIHGQELGDLAVRLVLDGGDSTAEARRMFGWLEQTRAQMYRYEPVSGIDDPQLVELIAEIRNLGYALRQAKLDGRPTTRLRSRYAERQRAAMRLGWHAASRWGKPRPVADFADVLTQLGSGALVSFAVSGGAMLAVVLTEGRVQLVRLGSAAQATENAMRLQADLNAMAPDHLPEPLFNAISTSARKHAAALDAQLMRPLAALTGDLVIVPTRALYAVPWGALDSLRSRPVVVAPSATAWLAASRSPVHSGHTALVRGPGLSAAIGEIDKLAAHYEKATLLAGPDATSFRVLESLDGASLVHIAAHGEHEAENALFSRLELVDGALFAHELARLERPPRQVVLAACELALHRIRPGDEALGFAGALLAGGVGTVVAAASRVGDLPAAAAMDDYHRALAAGSSPAVALAEAVAVDPLRRPFVCLGS